MESSLISEKRGTLNGQRHIHAPSLVGETPRKETMNLNSIKKTSFQKQAKDTQDRTGHNFMEVSGGVDTTSKCLEEHAVRS